VDVHVLDETGQPIPAGQKGELYVSGQALALGYWQQPVVTAVSFVGRGDGLRMYRTGDVGWVRADGVVEYVGRRDRQVKVSGHRVELEGVEAILATAPGVQGGSVRCVAGLSGQPRLIAWYKGPARPDEVRAYLASRLPAWSLPVLETVAHLPTLASGKIDGEALELRGAADGRLQAIWSSVLGQPVEASTHFFEAGGTSLLAMQVIHEVETSTGVRLPMAAFLTAPTLAQQSRLMEEAIEDLVVVPVRKSGTRRPLFLVHGIGWDVVGFWPLAQHLGTDQPVYAFQPHHVPSRVKTIPELAAFYLKHLRQVQPEGPYRVGGLSMGGLVAYEMAQQLIRQGQSVDMVLLLETWIPATMVPETPWHWIKRNLRDLGDVPARQRWNYLRKKAAVRADRAQNPDTAPPTPLLPPFLRSMEELANLLNNYDVEPYEGRTLLVRNAELPACLEGCHWLKWDQYITPPPSVFVTEGRHAHCIRMPAAAAVGCFIRQSLELLP
jgi:thioesterase domain-containing protein